MGRNLREFGEITDSWNPITGCLHNCSYCWSRRLSRRLASIGVEPYKTYGFSPALAEWRLRQRIPDGKFIFVCVAEDTLVNAIDGLLEIKDVNVGDVVLGLCGGLIVPSVIIAKTTIKTETIYRIVTDSTEIICSPTHRVLTLRGYVMAKDLKVGERVCVYFDEQNNTEAKFRLQRTSLQLDRGRSRVPVIQLCKHEVEGNSKSIGKRPKGSEIHSGLSTREGNTYFTKEVEGKNREMCGNVIKAIGKRDSLFSRAHRWRWYNKLSKDGRRLLSTYFRDNDNRYLAHKMVETIFLAERSGNKEPERQKILQGGFDRLWNIPFFELSGTVFSGEETSMPINNEVYKVEGKATLEGKTDEGDDGNRPRCQGTKLCWERVREVEVENSGEVLYDLKTTTHNYISNKIVSHNCDMGDMWGDWVPREWIEGVLRVVRSKPRSKFFFLTKNPKRYLEFENMFSDNVMLGVTLETNRDYGLTMAPTPRERYKDFLRLSWKHKAIVIEPILDFDEEFIDWIYEISPKVVYIGYDNYGNKLPEPKIVKTQILLEALSGITDLRVKTIRKAWYED
ncbi:DUF5131 family protein [Candidatus Bathyarchaeota archaeon]|nr:DUF5131 family protein [Candidatus Bathyarchaeota archaeon]